VWSESIFDDEAESEAGKLFSPVAAADAGVSMRGAGAGARRKQILTSNHGIAELFSFMCFDYKEAKINKIALCCERGRKKGFCEAERRNQQFSPPTLLASFGRREKFPHHDGVNYHMK
jgi:hypothetical protein